MGSHDAAAMLERGLRGSTTQGVAMESGDEVVGARQPLSAMALSHMLRTGRACPPQMLEQGVDPDAAWRRNEPVPIKRGPLLFDFKWLPKPQFAPSTSGAGDAPSISDGAAEHAGGLAGRKRKAQGEPDHESVNGVA